MSCVKWSLSAILYVDDMDLLHLNMERDKWVWEVHWSLQQSVNNWGKLLIATGGSLKPNKCFFHFLDFAWSTKGGWQYITHHEDRRAVITVPMPDGTVAPIAHKAVGPGAAMAAS